MSLFIILVVLAAVGAGLYFYVTMVTNTLTVAGTAMDKDTIVRNAQGVFGWLDAKLLNWKTVIVGWIGALTATFKVVGAEAFDGWKDLPWAQVVDTKVANWIILACGIIVPLLHAQGVAKAALSPPPSPGA